MAHPAVTGAVMFGRGRHQCGVLIEIGPEYEVDRRDPASLERLRELIW